MNEVDYEAGFRAAWLRILSECVKVLGPVDSSAESWRLEREETILVLRILCDDFELSNGWDNKLHLADVIDKHVRRPLESRDFCTSEERAVIDAALTFHRIGLDLNAYFLKKACDALLAARAKEGKKLHRVTIHAIFETGTTQTDCDGARTTCENLFNKEVAEMQSFSVVVKKVEVEPLTEGSAQAYLHTCQQVGE